MWKYSSPRFFFRGGALFYLYLHGALYFRDSLSMVFTVVSFSWAPACAFLLDRSRLRLLPALAAAAALPWVFRAAALLPLSLLASAADPVAFDLAALGFERNFRLLLPSFLAATGTTLLYFRSPRWREAEPALFGLLLLPLFWAQGNFRITLYDHPFSFGLSLFGFLILTLLQTLFSAPSDFSATSGGETRKAICLLPLILVLGVLLSWIFGRYGDASVAAGGGLLKPALFRFDFSSYLTLESEIRLNKDLVLLYRRDGPLDRYLLRRYVLDGYKPGSMFFQDPAGPDAPHPETVPDRSVALPLRETEGRRLVGQELYLVNLEPSALITLDYPVEIVPFQNWKGSSFTRIYKADAMAFELLPFELSDAAGSGLSGPDLAYYLVHGKDQKIQALAEEITEGLPTYYDRVQAVNDYLKYEYYYSLKPGVSTEGNQLHHFLFTGKKGYCSYFAFAMALLCRSIGIPARVAVGFYIDPGTEVLGFYPVRSDMAHAWVEVYFDGFGWIDFDPTSETIAPGEEFTLDSGFEKDKVISLLEEIITNRNALLEKSRETAPPGAAESGALEKLYAALKKLVPLGKLLLSVFVPAGLVLFRLRHTAAARLARAPRRKTTEGFAALLQDLSGLGYRRNERESLSEYILRVQAASELPLEGPHALFQKARYAGRFEPEDAAAFAEAAGVFRRSLRGSYTFPRRVLRYLHPASFGARP
jgi:transglutaminase-like putative cysteine protease